MSATTHRKKVVVGAQNKKTVKKRAGVIAAVAAQPRINYAAESEKLGCQDDPYSPACNKLLLSKENTEREQFGASEAKAADANENSFLYPNLNDPQFNIKIAEKKEFNDLQYDGTIHEDIKAHADMLANSDFELQPQQAFSKNFLSSQTPYNAILEYHGLGSGKTCTGLSITEDIRTYNQQLGIKKRIIIVASENVQDNFRLQLFDERHLKQVNGVWNIRGCVGNKLLKEINPMNMPMSREKVISSVKNLINSYYVFFGYVQFANYIIKTLNYDGSSQEIRRGNRKQSIPATVGNNKAVHLPTPPIKPKKRGGGGGGGGDRKVNVAPDAKFPAVLPKHVKQRLRQEFENRTILIDEVHNIRKTEDNENKKVAQYLELLVSIVQGMKLIFLSATPMYNSYKEIIWLLNILNMNDRRGKIEISDVFDKHGNFKPEGEELLIRKATGYVSFVRGENPFTFPYRIYPRDFAPKQTFPAVPYPSYQMNLKKIKHENKKRILGLYLTTIGGCGGCGNCQYCMYRYILHYIRNRKQTITTKYGAVREMPSFENMDAFGYTLLQMPLESLIITYPVQGFKTLVDQLPKEKFEDEYSPSFADGAGDNGDDDYRDDGSMVGGAGGNSSDASLSSLESLEESSMATSDDVEPVKVSTSDDADTATQVKFEIDPRILTGRGGLERNMRFLDTMTPPTKGEFEYKPETLTNFGRIFSPQIIGKYSAKIKAILDAIYNPKTGRVSSGIILIYCQYIDGGLIPIALALEEAGFTRYGGKPLFKTQPVEPVDVATMKPVGAAATGAHLAKYSMITGDARLSPNVDEDVKYITHANNIHGEKVKVILISRTGSEGIDLKGIRQCHVVDPWYNMNRVEQILGRSVRNFSHKDLPFEDRNVEIYMHGTILDKNVEEAADLYVYRVAEYKAIQMGKVARVLKETSIDCILNYGQTNFTQEKIAKYLKHGVMQRLSSGQILRNFKIGDAPFSPTCDYMATCNYSCRPFAKAEDLELNEDTYSEAFIIMNSDKIVKKIRMLFREGFFYKKQLLIDMLQTPKKYPLVQIYAALTMLIEDENEFITDKYGRMGRLVNVGEYYLFQPAELLDKNVSIFDRSVPIDVKQAAIKFEGVGTATAAAPAGKVAAAAVTASNPADVIATTDKTRSPLTQIEDQYREYSTAKNADIAEIIINKETSWFEMAGYIASGGVATELPRVFGSRSSEAIDEYVIEHAIELLFFEDKLALLNVIYSEAEVGVGTEAGSRDVVKKIREYFEKHSIVTPKHIAYILYNVQNMIFIMFDRNKKQWVAATPEDKREIAVSPQAKSKLEFQASKYNELIGFIGYEKNKKYMIFKTKNMTSKRDTGARCDESTKQKNIDKLNSIMGYQQFYVTNPKDKHAAAPPAIAGKLAPILLSNNDEICAIEELVMRHYNATQKDGKQWFLTPEMALFYKLYVPTK